MTTTPIIAAENLHKTYRMGRVRVPVLRGLSISVEQGECVAVLGASGSGKSTLLHLLGGLDRPDRKPPARIAYDNRILGDMPSAELDRYRASQVGFVFQFYHLLPELRVLENVTVGAMVRHGRFGYLAKRGAIARRAADLLDAFGLAHRLRHRPGELSGGERQRVAIARALINEPRILLADEPTGNLDARTAGIAASLIKEMCAENGAALLLVSHDSNILGDFGAVRDLGEINRAPRGGIDK